MCHERRTPRLSLSGRPVIPASAFSHFTDAALDKVISGIQGHPNPSVKALEALQTALGEKAHRDLLASYPIAGVSGVDPELQALSPQPAVVLVPPASTVGDILHFLNSLTDDADDSTPTIPAKAWELLLEKVLRLPVIPVEVVVKLLGGADSANSGGDVIPPTNPILLPPPRKAGSDAPTNPVLSR